MDISPRENLDSLLSKKFPRVKVPGTTTCSLVLYTVTDDMKQHFTNQIAEEMIRVSTRSREILKKRIVGNEETGSLFREGDEYLLHSPSVETLQKFLADRMSQDLISYRIPFGQATDNSLGTYQKLVPIETPTPKALVQKSSDIPLFVGHSEKLPIRILKERVTPVFAVQSQANVSFLDQKSSDQLLRQLQERNNVKLITNTTPQKMTIRFIS
jgi:hypothetical protein